MQRLLRYYSKKGPDIEAQNLLGETPLFAAISQGHKDAVQLLLDSGANGHAIYYLGPHPLSRIIDQVHEDIAKLWIEKGHWHPGLVEAFVLWCSTPFAKIVMITTLSGFVPICVLYVSWYKSDSMAVMCLMLFLVTVVKVLTETSKHRALREGQMLLI